MWQTSIYAQKHVIVHFLRKIESLPILTLAIHGRVHTFEVPQLLLCRWT